MTHGKSLKPNTLVEKVYCLHALKVQFSSLSCIGNRYSRKIKMILLYFISQRYQAWASSVLENEHFPDQVLWKRNEVSEIFLIGFMNGGGWGFTAADLMFTLFFNKRKRNAK